jgi:hypothetical protein
MKKKLLAVALFPLTLVGCDRVLDPGEPIVCTLIAVSSLNVTVRDLATSQRVCDATVTAVLAGASYELRRSGSADACTYSGPEERAGSFEVRVSKAGYDSAAARDIRVAADECHVIPVQITVDLRRSTP